jgi:hypothetical protein
MPLALSTRELETVSDSVHFVMRISLLIAFVIFDLVDEKIKALDKELMGYKEQLKKVC